jgi:small subunit ribosomal protein S16
MVIIRLSRGGATKRAFYHIVVADSRKARDGRYIERIGFFNPKAATHEPKLKVNLERVEFWVARGAQTSDRVSDLIKEFRGAAAA